MPKIGAHVSAASNLSFAFDRAFKIKAECFQIFISPPQQWNQTVHNSEIVEKFKKNAEVSGIGDNLIHSTYLVNLGTSNPEHLEKSTNWLIYALNMAVELGIKGVIVHTGSTGTRTFKEALQQIVQSIKKILDSTKIVLLILETAAGSGNTIGDNFEELGQILKAVDNPRLKICLDTQHVFASGYDIRSREGLDKTLKEFDFKIGLENLVVIHSSDSKTELDSNKDRHENIGEGLIGLEGFRNIVNHPKLKDIPFILEVPGYDKKGPDEKNVTTLKSLMSNPKNSS